MPLVRDLHPEFGYLGSLHFFGRRLGLVLVFVGFGVLAGMSGLAVFMAGEQPDPLKAMALAPPQAMAQPPASVANAPADIRLRPDPPTTADSRAVQPSCEGESGSECARPKPFRPRFVPAANERPAIAAVPIGRIDPPALSSTETSPPPAPAEQPAVAALPEPADAASQASEVTPAPAPAPPPRATKKQPRHRVQQAERHERYREREQSSPRSNFGSPVWAGYARVY